ncbi:hypothetical protein HLK66_25340 (plasmid) [Niallia circulans]|uniref:hypothetical protein n=1 Tax=Niallia circulans TaxID=1397 RepID=UPI00148F590D|nr:hypothetical protein [Niallia circulans]QJX65017.1 hypothetical protein HLK66_25340 [Niallia circulans]
MNKIQELISSLFSAMGDWIASPFKSLPTLKNLIFGGDENLAFLTFTENEITKVYTPGMNIFTALAVTALLISIIMAAMKISSTSINPSNRTYVIEYFKELLLVSVLFANLYSIYAILFLTNQAIVGLFGSDVDLLNLKNAIEMSKYPGGVLGVLAITIVKVGLCIWAYFYYSMRKFTLMLLLITGPLMLVFFLIPQTKSITVAWFKELVGTIFVQSIHAAVYFIMAVMVGAANPIEAVILMIIFIPVTESLRALIGLGGKMNDGFSKAAAMMGGSALVGMYGAAKGALEGTSVTDAIKRGYLNAKNKGKGNGKDSDNVSSEDKDPVGDIKKTLAGNTGTDTGTTANAEKMLKPGNILSRSGKAVFGATGALAGSALGPMGVLTGSTIGFHDGGVAGGLAGRVGGASAQLLANRGSALLKSGLKGFKDINNADKAADEQLANTIADEKATAWANENEEGFRKDFKERFPDAHEEAVNKAWDNEKASKKAGFLNEARGMVAGMKSKEGKNANASSLVKNATSNLTNKWAEKNKEPFMKEYDQKNPLPENASKEEISRHQNARENAWQSQLKEKESSIQNLASDVANDIGNGASLNHSYINKEDFEKRMAERMAGGISQKAIAKTSTNLAKDWAKDNKDNFMKNYDEKNPLPLNATAEQKSAHSNAKAEAWKNEIDNKQKSIANVLGNGNLKLRNGQEKNQLFTNQLAKDIGSIIGVNENSEKMDQISDQLHNVYSPNPISTATQSLTSSWAKDNKASFMKNYDKSNPLPDNATSEVKANHAQQKQNAWDNQVQQKQQKLGNILTSQSNAIMSGKNVPLENVTKSIAQELGISTSDSSKMNAISSQVQTGLSSVQGASSKVSNTTEVLASSWAKNNKQNFMKNYDKSNPLPANATSEMITSHNQQKEKAWNSEVQQKQQSISNIIRDNSNAVLHGTPSQISKVTSAIAKEMGISSNNTAGMNAITQQLQTGISSPSLVDKGLKSISSINNVKDSIASVKGTSMYSGKEVNVPYVNNQIASMKINEARETFANNSNLPRAQAYQNFDSSGKAQEITSSVQKSMPSNIPLGQRIIQKSAGRITAGLGNGLVQGVVGASGLKEVSQFVGDTRIGHATKTLGMTAATSFIKNKPNLNSLAQNPTQLVSAAKESIVDGGKAFANDYKSYTPSNLVEKQAKFRNAVAYAGGMVAGVGGYQVMAKYAAPSISNSKAFGLKGFNPYNNAVNKQIKEISDVAHMAQTVTLDNGQTEIAQGAIQMVTDNKNTVVQVRDKTGQTHVVSRMASGHSGLKNNQVVYQDLTVREGQLLSASSSYSLDSGGGKVPAPKINVNPNQLFTNRNTSKTPRVVQEVQSYNQLVDSGQYYMKDALNEMENIKMVIDHNRSYMTGTRNGTTYRISPYGPGDARVQNDKTITANCEVQNKKLIPSFSDSDFTTSLKPEDLMAYAVPNKRNFARKQLEMHRNKAFTSSLR